MEPFVFSQYKLLILRCCSTRLHDCRNNFLKNMINVPGTLVDGDFRCPELLNAGDQFLLVCGLHLGF